MHFFKFLLLPFLFSLHSLSLLADSFKPGDILLAPMNCYLCKLIEMETNSSYSHLFIFIGDGSFAHSLSKVEYISFFKIKQIVDSSRPMLLVRHNDSNEFNTSKLKNIFENSFLGLPYDKDFSWDNFDNRGREKLYCSEFVLKLMNNSFNLEMSPVPMTYDYYYEVWENYFQGGVPEGLPGVAPSFFEKNDNFRKIKYIYSK